jgi:long-chain acyl-CoA synthetase
VSSDIVRRRAEIEAVMAGRTLCDELRHVAETCGDAWAYSDEAVTGAGDGWQSLTWSQARQQVLETAAGFAALGLAPGERVALMLPNCSGHVLADLGAVHAGGLGVTLYATLAAEQIAYVAADCDARIAVLDGAAELARWQPILGRLPGITKIIVRDPAACPAGDRYMTWADFAALGRERYAAGPGEITARVAAIKPGHPLALLYTSGTTGNPKGVLLTHRNVLYQMAAADTTGLVTPRVRWVSYLPLAHIAERMLSIYAPIHVAGHVHFCPDATQLVRVIGKVRPTAFFGVPRVWEKVRAGIQALLAAEQDEDKRAAVAQAMDIGRRYVQSCQYGQTTSPELAAQFHAVHHLGSQRRRPAAPGRGRLPGRAGHEDPRHLRHDGNHRGVHRQHAYRIPARNGRPACPRHGGQDRRRRRDPGPRAADHSRLPEPARPDRGPHRCRRMAADRRHRNEGRGRVRLGDRPEEGTSHHRGR